MLLGKLFEQFVEESPISVMMRGIVEYAFEAKRLDDIFEDTAETQHTRTLRFSTIADLMSEVVFDISPWDGRGGGKCIGILPISGDLQDLFGNDDCHSTQALDSVSRHEHCSTCEGTQRAGPLC